MDKKRIYITVFLAITGIAVCLWTSLKPGKKEVVIETLVADSETASVSDVKEESRTVFPVYIGGAVQQPGIYEIEEYVYLYQLIDRAGGFSEEADMDHIDRVYLIDHSQSLYIPKKGEYSDEPHVYVPVIGHQHEDNNEEKKGNGKVDINTADVSELSQLPGIGEKTAEKILQYRETNGSFKKKEDIMKVSGIGESKYEKIKDLIFAG